MRQGETMMMDCADEGETGCELCGGDDGCQFEEGSQLEINAGVIRLPASANASAVKMKPAQPPSRSMLQMWTVLRNDGPNHLGLWTGEDEARPRRQAQAGRR